MFSSLNPGETVVDLSFSHNGERILITTQYKCIEVHVAVQTIDSVFVAQSGQNERFASGQYCQDEVEIAVVEHEKNGAPRIKPRCDYYSRVNVGERIAYSLIWSYMIPTLDEQDYQYFLHSYNDFGVGCSNDTEGIQSYWVTRGFFTTDKSGLKQYSFPQSFEWAEGKRVPVEKTVGGRYLYVRHKHELTNRYHIGKGNCSFSVIYLSDDWSEGVITDDGTCLLFTAKPQCVSWEDLDRQFREHFSNVPPYTMWSFAVPYDDDSLLACYDGFKLMLISKKDNMTLDDVHYYPGVSIYGCNFRGASITENAKETVIANGGILTETPHNTKTTLEWKMPHENT